MVVIDQAAIFRRPLSKKRTTVKSISLVLQLSIGVHNISAGQTTLSATTRTTQTTAENRWRLKHGAWIDCGWESFEKVRVGRDG